MSNKEISIKKSTLAAIIITAVIIVGISVSSMLIMSGKMNTAPEETDPGERRTTVTDLTEKDPSGFQNNDPYKGESKPDKDGHLLPVKSNADITIKKTVTDHKCSYRRDYVVKSTCTSEGYTVYKCSCGKQYVADYKKVRAHDYTDSNCKAPATCRLCGDTIGEKGDHKWDIWTSTGSNSHKKTCSVCGKVGTEEPHVMNVADPVYCYAHKCSKCGRSDYKSVSSDGHGGYFRHAVSNGVCIRCGYSQ